MTANTNVLYLFAGERRKLLADWEKGAMPDSHLIGFNHLKDFGVDARYIENRFLNYIRKKNFNLTNLFLLPALFRYDVVFSGASLFLPLVAKVILRMKRPKFVWYNTFFTNTLKRNSDNKFKLWLLRKTIASLDAIVCPSTAQRDFLIAEGFDATKIFFVPNGIDIEFMSRKIEPSRNTKPFILSVGKDNGRDYQTLAEAVKDLPIEVRVAALPRNLSGVKNIPPNLKVLGFVAFPKLVELYREALFVVIPTKSEKHLDASDCSGQYVLLDAMSLGKAIVASERETLADYFSDQGEGLIVPAENPGALRKAIERLLADQAFAVRLGERAKTRSERYTTKKLAENLAGIFRQVVDKK
ncbi:MAG: glycosyltransferase family 4 protein [Patescibacteria group bacterium]